MVCQTHRFKQLYSTVVVRWLRLAGLICVCLALHRHGSVRTRQAFSGSGVYQRLVESNVRYGGIGG